MKVTVGGNRLGSGKKLTTDLKSYERSTHDMGYTWRSSMSSGTLVPFINEVALPGDTFDIKLDVNVLTHPTVGPLFGSYKVQCDVFLIPMRLYNGLLHNNMLGVGMDMSKIKLPLYTLISQITAPTDDNDHVNPSSIAKYLGVSGIGTNGDVTRIQREYNAIPLLGYWDIFKNYYANKQEEQAYVIHTEVTDTIKTVSAAEYASGTTFTALPKYPSVLPTGLTMGSIRMTFTTGQPNTASNDFRFIDTDGNRWQWNEIFDTAYETIDNTVFSKATGVTAVKIMAWDYITTAEATIVPPTLYPFPLENIDLMRETLLKLTDKNAEAINISNNGIAPYTLISQITADGKTSITHAQEGLAVKTYQSDQFNNWIDGAWIEGGGRGYDGISQITAVDTSSGKFTIDQLNLSKKVYDMLNRIALSGGSYDDWIETVYTNGVLRKASTPIYMGGLSKELVFQEVIATASNTNGNFDTTPLGALAGKGTMSRKHKGGEIRIKVDEPSYIMGIGSITPRVDYSQGNKWDVNLKTWDDLHKPALDEIGFQDLLTDQFAWWNTEIINDPDEGQYPQFNSIGKQPAWINYMTNVNRVYGNFAIKENEMFMVLNRRYEQDTAAGDIRDATTYIDPTKFNYIFAETSLDAMNFWTQIGVDMIVRRKMSAKIIPNL